MPRLLQHKLTEPFVQYAPNGMHCDGNGLYLHVRGNSRTWNFRYFRHGKSTRLGLGPVRTLDLADARATATRLQKALRDGRDPKHERDGTSIEIPTFEWAARELHARSYDSWSSPRHRREWLSSLKRHVFPRIGRMPVDQIEPRHVLAVLEPIWLTKPETARRVRQRISTVLDVCITRGERMNANPCTNVHKALPTQRTKRGRMVALPWQELPDVLKRLQHCERTSLVAKMALAFLIHTAARSAEVKGARWQEIDFENACWTVPAERMKARRAHRVPLNHHAIACLKRMQAYLRHEDSGLIFPGRTGRILSNNTLIFALRDAAPNSGDASVHGLRSSFRDWAAEVSDTKPEICEAALAHTPKSQVEAAYLRTDFFEKRRDLMHAWGRYLSGQMRYVRPSLVKYSGATIHPPTVSGHNRLER